MNDNIKKNNEVDAIENAIGRELTPTELCDIGIWRIEGKSVDECIARIKADTLIEKINQVNELAAGLEDDGLISIDYLQSVGNHDLVGDVVEAALNEHGIGGYEIVDCDDAANVVYVKVK